jgi:beta-lactamase regulating signal transducer with metallopeptidase domain
MTAWYLTWLWQGTALTLLTAAAVRIVPRLNAATRYWIWWGALAGVAWLGLRNGAGPGPAEASSAAPLVVVPAAPDVWVAVALGIWAGVALVKLIRVLAAVEGIWALRARCRSIPEDVEAQLPLWLAGREQGRSSRLMLCDDVAGATLLGFGRPIVALPRSMVTTLKPGQLDAVVLHEHAHAQRRDDWMTLMQALIQALVWIHPAAAAIGRALNFEREVACDERVVARTASPKDYARCLTRAAEIRSAKHQTALGSALFGAAGQLARRIDRLLSMSGSQRFRASRLAALGGTCAIGVVAVQLHTLPAVAEIGDVVVPAVAAAGRLMVGADAAPVEARTAAAQQPTLAQRRQPRLLASAPATPGTPESAESGQAANSAAFFSEEIPTATMADINHAAYHEIEPLRNSARANVQSPEPAQAEETAQRGPFWRRFERAGVGLGGAFANFGQSIARRF